VERRFRGRRAGVRLEALWQRFLAYSRGLDRRQSGQSNEAVVQSKTLDG
jgi:hypothetical protein